MRLIKHKGLKGKEIIEYIPETEDDIKLLRQMEKKNLLDTRNSFADDPEKISVTNK